MNQFFGRRSGDLTKTVWIYTDCNLHRDFLNAAAQPEALKVNVGVSVFDSAVMPLFDLLVDLLVQFANGACGHSCSTKDLR